MSNEEQMGRSGGTAEIPFLIRSTVKCKCIEVPKSVLNLKIQFQIFPLTLPAVLFCLAQWSHLPMQILQPQTAFSVYQSQKVLKLQQEVLAAADATISDTTITSNKDNQFEAFAIPIRIKVLFLKKTTMFLVN